MKKSLLLIPAIVFFVNYSIAQNVFNKTFTRADTLRGTLTPLRTCYDVTYYHLDVKIDPETKFINGSNTVQFKVVNVFKRMQIDLVENMKIEMENMNVEIRGIHEDIWKIKRQQMDLEFKYNDLKLFVSANPFGREMKIRKNPSMALGGNAGAERDKKGLFGRL